MPVFVGKVRDKRGHKVRTIEIQARDENEARRAMERQGRVLAFERRFGLNIVRAMTADERQIFFGRLASMLRSRVGTGAALALIRDNFSGKIQEISGRLLALVESGDDLADAIEKIGAPDFPEATCALISAGAASGESWRAIKDAAEFEHQLHLVKQSAGKGLMSGIIGFIIAAVITFASSFYFGPKIMDSDLIKAGIAKGTVNIGWINTAGDITGYIMAILATVFVAFWALASVGRRISPTGADRLILKVPFYKDLILAKNNFIVLYGLSLLIKSGVRTEEALKLAASGAPRGALRSDLVSAVDRVRTGKPWPTAMSTFHPTDKAALMSASDREQTATSLDALATQYRELYAQRLASFVPALQLVSSLFLSIAGGILFGQSILPMLMASSGAF